MGTVRVLPRVYVANFVFEFDCSKAFSFRDVTFVMPFFKRSKGLEIKTFQKFEVSEILVVASFSSKYPCLKPRSFQDMKFFMIFFKNILRKIKFDFFSSKFGILEPEVGGCQSSLKRCES